MDHRPDQLALNGDELSIVVAPRIGGRLIELIHVSSGRQWLWSNPTVPLQPMRLGDVYDDVWVGGFEELFPNDAPTALDGVEYPDHGELWSTSWAVEETSTSSARLAVTGPVTGVEVSKLLVVDGPSLTITYELHNPGDRELHHLFKLHPAFAVDEHCTIDLPGGTVEKVEPGLGNLLEGTDIESWPTDADLSRCRSAASDTNEFVYVSDLPEGWCGLTDTTLGSWIRIEYPRDVFPYCWIFATYGGWRDHNVVVLEPCTNYPKDLSQAIARGTAARLDPGETLGFQVRVTVGEVGEGKT